MLPVLGAKSNSTYRPRSFTRESAVNDEVESLADEPGFTTEPFGSVAVKPPLLQLVDVAAEALPTPMVRTEATEMDAAAAAMVARRRREDMGIRFRGDALP